MHKKRGYKRDTAPELLRDYKLFAIACEGRKREPAYFSVFQYISRRIAVDVIEEIVTDTDMNAINKSAPRWLLDRAMKYIEKEGLSDDDDLWFVMDKDRWSEVQLREIAHYCEQYPNWHIVISNPCFEVWLYFHKRKDISRSKSASCNDFKNEISTFEKGGFHPFTYVPNLSAAVINAKTADKDPTHFIPLFKQTKVYQLGETLTSFIGKKDFDNFLENILPKLIQNEVQQTKELKKKKQNRKT